VVPLVNNDDVSTLYKIIKRRSTFFTRMNFNRTLFLPYQLQVIDAKIRPLN